MSWNFSLILFVALLVTGLVWLVDRLFLRQKRTSTDKRPWWVEYGASFFPVILFLLLSSPSVSPQAPCCQRCNQET